MRNALAPLSSALEIMGMAAGDNEDVAELLPVARRQIGQLSVLTQDLLDLGRAVNNEFQLDFARESVQDLVSTVVAAWRVLAKTKEQTLALEMTSAPLFVRADRVRLAQALQNIIGNAVKFTPDKGRVDVRVRAGANELTISVSDSGVGIPPADIDHVFELFYSARRDAAGTAGFGIGLALTRRLIELHGGTISVHSEGAGRGATFTVTLPLWERAGPA
jgi:signal transduction histidine kinase